MSLAKFFKLVFFASEKQESTGSHKELPLWEDKQFLVVFGHKKRTKLMILLLVSSDNYSHFTYLHVLVVMSNMFLDSLNSKQKSILFILRIYVDKPI